MAGVNLATAYITILPSMSGFRGALQGQMTPDATAGGDEAGGAFTKAFGGALKIAALAGGALIGAGAVFAKGAITEASSVVEATNKVGQVFGEAGQQVLDFGKSAADSFGISNREALASAGTFGNLLVGMDLTQQQSADMSIQLVKTAADLASFNDSSPTEALDALRSGLSGETEPLKRFGINMNDTTLKAEALRLGLLETTVDMDKLSQAQEVADKAGRKSAEALSKFGKESVQYTDAVRDQEQAERKLAVVMEGKVPASLSAAQKAQAAYSLTLSTVAKQGASGDVQRSLEGGSLAVALSFLKAKFQDIQAAVGAYLLPAAVQVVKFLTATLPPAFSKAKEVVTGFVEDIKGFVSKLDFGSILDAVKSIDFGAIFGAIGDGFGKVFDLVSKIDFVEIFGKARDLIADLVPHVIDFVQAFGKFSFNLIKEAFDIIADNKETIYAVFNFIKDVAVKAIDGLSGVFGFLSDHMSVVAPIIIGITAAFATYKVVTGTIAAATKIWSAAQAILNAVMAANPAVLIAAAIIGLAAAIYLAYQRSETFRDILDAIGNFFKTVFIATIHAVEDAFHAVVDALKDFGSSVADAFGATIDFVTSIPQKITDAFAAAGNFLLDVGKSIMGGLKDGVVAGFEILKFYYVDLPLKILNAIGDVAKTLFNKGQDLINGLKDGIVNAFTFVSNLLGGYPQKILDLYINAGRLLYDVGSNIVYGLRDGIVGAWHWVTDKVQELINKIPGPIRKILGISSPSKVFMEIGQNIVDGLTLGIEQKTAEPPAAVASLGRTLANTQLPGLRATAGLTGEYAGAGGGASQNITVNAPTNANPFEIADAIAFRLKVGV